MHSCFPLPHTCSAMLQTPRFVKLHVFSNTWHTGRSLLLKPMSHMCTYSGFHMPGFHVCCSELLGLREHVLIAIMTCATLGGFKEGIIGSCRAQWGRWARWHYIIYNTVYNRGEQCSGDISGKQKRKGQVRQIRNLDCFTSRNKKLV